MGIKGTPRPTAGRKPKPIETHIRNGNPSKIPLPEPVPVPRDRPAVPEHYDEDSTAYWNSFCDRVESMGVLTSFDAESMEMLVDSWRGYREMQAHVMEHGYVQFTKSGNSISGYFAARNKLAQQITSLLIQFGFTPVARAQIARANMKPDEAEDDPLLAMMKKRAERN